MYCISVNHKNSDAFIREKYALNELEKKEFYDKVRKNKNISGCICLMTCNRNEIYFEGNKAAVSEIENIYKEIKNIDYIKTLAKENNEKKIFYGTFYSICSERCLICRNSSCRRG